MTIGSIALSPREVAPRLGFEALFNMRDLGGQAGRAGLTIRSRSVYRADSLARATIADRAMLTSLGIRTVIDLRTAGERKQTGVIDLGPDVTNNHWPLQRRTWLESDHEPATDAITFLTNRYTEMLVQGAPTIARLISFVADRNNHPLVFHCAIGKDRTGVVSMVLLGLLGVREETITDDYCRSILAVAELQNWLHTNNRAAAARLRTQPRAYLDAPPEVVPHVFSWVRQNFGSMIGYARNIGVSFEEIEELHDLLLN